MESPQKPEAFRLMVGVWAVMIVGELLHQALAVVFVFLDPSALKQAAKDTAQQRGGEASELLVNFSMYSAVVLMALVQLAIVVLFAVALRAVAKRTKWAPNALRLLQVFAFFFAFRMLTLFLMSPASAAIPVALYAVDGVVQIVLAVAAVMGVYFSTRDETRQYFERELEPERR